MNYPNQISQFSESLTQATIDIFEYCIHPFFTDSKSSHYRFSLHHLTGVLNGIALVNPNSIESKSDLISIWLHEMIHKFSDLLQIQEEKEIL
jgi:hypothetical protein